MTRPTATQNLTLAPALRFPAFRREPWQEKLIGNFLEECRRKGSAGDIARKLTVKLWGKGVFEKVESLSGSENTQYYRRSAGQLIYSKLDFLNGAFGVIPPELDGLESTVDLPCFDISNELHPNFLLEYVKRPAFYEKFGEIADGGRKAKRIQAESFLSFPICVPRQFAEQQKIAECLSTLDELIGAESQKLDALKAHKKGLMQQLFPREGETLPRLRFPDFHSAPEWKEKSLSKVAENLDNRRVPITEKDRVSGSVPYYGASGIVDYVKDHLFDEDLLCVSEDGANLVARTYPIAFSISGKTWVNNHAHVLRFENRFTQKMVEDYLNALDLTDYLTGMAQPKLNKAMLDKIPILLPEPDEQHRIATCLSSLDDLIAAQSDRLAALQTHKQGLLQQLFPDSSQPET